MSKEITFASTPAELTSENREATIKHLIEQGFPVNSLGNIIEKDGVQYVVFTNDSALPLEADVPVLSITAEDIEAAAKDISIDERLANIAKAAIAFQLSYNPTMCTMHIALTNFAPERLTFDIEKDTVTIQNVIKAQDNGEHSLMLMKLSAIMQQQ